MKQIPNILSFFRILLIPLFIISVTKDQLANAGILLVISGATDVLDGFLARRFNWMTPLGALLDPLADKLTQTAVSISFIFVLKEFVFLFAVLILKDLLMLVASAYAVKKKIHFTSALWFGKAATFIFYASMILILLVPTIPESVQFGMVAACTVSAVFACVMYLRVFLKVAIPEHKGEL